MLFLFNRLLCLTLSGFYLPVVAWNLVQIFNTIVETSSFHSVNNVDTFDYNYRYLTSASKDVQYPSV